ncbi:MAG: hypothetical protein M3441_14415 [Chloroflexota bacterium]|nr:hypothetical protein [Chloroflexota bacterium]
MSPVPSTPSRHRNRLGIAAALGVLALIVAGCFLGAIVGPSLLARLFPGLAFVFTGELPLDAELAKSSGPSRPFAEIWDVAHDEALRIDPGAILVYVSASPVGYIAGVAYSGPLTGSLEMSFEFIRPDGRSISIDFEDADPASTLTIRSGHDEASPEGEARYQDGLLTAPEKQRRIESYKLSPRDAVALTWDDALEYARKHGLLPGHVLPLITSSRTKEGRSVWEVNYWYKLPTNSISLREIFDVSDGVVYFIVDGETGEILRRDYQTIDPTRTPSR